MALFDGLFGNQYGGLLGDMQRWMRPQEEAQAAFAQPTSHYQFGGQHVPVYGQAPQQPEMSSQSRMQPQQQAMPQQQAPMTMGDRMDAAGEGAKSGAAMGPLGALLGGLGGLVSGSSTPNATEQALIARGVDPVLAKAARKSPQIMQAILPQYFGAKNTSVQMIDRPDGSGYKDPYIFDAGTGRLTPAILPGAQGQQPQGQPAPGGIPIPQAPAGLSKDGREAWDKKAAQEAVERITNAPQAKARARDSIEALLKTGQEAMRLSTHEGLDAAVGPISGRLPTFYDETANFEADTETLATRIFINTINRMRELSKTGGAVGQVTEKEMTKLENSQKSLSLKQGEGNMRANLRGIASEVNDSMANIAAAYKEQYGENLPFQKIEVPSDKPKGNPAGDRLREKYGLK
jgi:hypothetical protein